MTKNFLAFKLATLKWVEQLAKHIQKFVILNKLTIYARFALYNTEEFHRLKESLARLPLEKIELFIDPQYENNSETDNWTEGQVGQKRVKIEVKYVKWSQL